MLNFEFRSYVLMLVFCSVTVDYIMCNKDERWSRSTIPHLTVVISPNILAELRVWTWVMCHIPQVVSQRIPLVQTPPLRQGSKNIKIACSIYSVPAYEASNSQEHMCISDSSNPFIYEVFSWNRNYNEFNVQF